MRAEGGVTWGELNAAAAEHGLAVTGGAVSTTGIAGLTLGGGLGWLMARFGLAADNLLEVELVTANGEVTHVNEASDPDLFWALRGGGGNFGVATVLTYRLHPLDSVTGGLIAHPFAAAGDLLRFYRDAVADAPDELEIFAGLVHAPDGSGTKLAVLIVCHSGIRAGRRRPRSVQGVGLAAARGRRSDAVPDDQYAARRGLSGVFPELLAVELHERAVRRADRRCRRALRVHALADERDRARALPRWSDSHRAHRHRRPPPRRGLEPADPVGLDRPAETEANVAWTRDTHVALKEHLVDRRWLNYLGHDQGVDAVRAAYGPNWDRLVAVKRRVDPENVFHLNHNIPPG